MCLCGCDVTVTGELWWIVGETQQYNISDGSTFRKKMFLCVHKWIIKEPWLALYQGDSLHD